MKLIAADFDFHPKASEQLEIISKNRAKKSPKPLANGRFVAAERLGFAGSDQALANMISMLLSDQVVQGKKLAMRNCNIFF